MNQHQQHNRNHRGIGCGSRRRGGRARFVPRGSSGSAAKSRRFVAHELTEFREAAARWYEQLQSDSDSVAFSTDTACTAVVDTPACTGCGVCVSSCPVHAICVQDSIARIDTERCIGCGACVQVCPRRAISLTGHEVSEN